MLLPDQTRDNMTDTQITTTSPLSVFITGATGALGREVTRQLVAAGYRVTGAVNGSADATKVRADGGVPAYPNIYRAGELRSIIQGAVATIVLNLAPQLPNHVPQQNAHWDERLAEATTALMEAAAQAGVEFVVHTSYAFADERAEDAAAILRAARAAERVALNGNVPASVLRMGFLYGAESEELIALHTALKQGRPVTAGPSDARANWVYVADAARAVILAAERRPAGALLNIVDDQPASPAEFIGYFAQSQGLSIMGGLPLFAKRSALPKAQLAVMSLNNHADNSAAKETLGWTPRFSSYQQGIDDTLLSWRAQQPVVS
jgi:nucleoside-diphosphate-sugar epimerase